MKRFNILLVFFFLLSFGAEIEATDATSAADMTKTYEQLKVTDTLQVKFKAVVTDVCQSKGCWMKLELTNGEKAMVRFKDYGFFMPFDIKGKEVIVNGLAFVEEMSVENQQHYAKDAGKSAEEIAQIRSPKKTFGFEADGVLLKD